MRLLIGFFLSLGLVVGSQFGAGAQSITFTLKEKLQEKVVCDGSCEEVPFIKFLSKLQVTVDPEMVASFDNTTTFSVFLGDFKIGLLLGSDPNYQTGDTSARFRLEIIQIGSDIVSILDIKLSWKSGKIKMTLKGSGPALDSPIAAAFVGDPPGQLSSNTVLLFTMLDPGDLNLLVDINPSPVKGKLTRTTKNVDGVDYELDKISATTGTQ